MKNIKSIFLHFIMIIFSLIFLLPFLWLLSTSLKSPNELFTQEIVWLPNPPIWKNYLTAIEHVNLFSAFKNTIFLCFVNVIGVIFSCSLAAYAFSVLNWKLKNVFFYLTLATMMLPEMVTLVPQFILFQKLGLYGTYIPLIAPYIFGNAFYIFLLRQFFLTIPKDLHESASMDGASELLIYFKIYLPLSIPALSVVALFQFLVTWNDLIRPSVYLVNENQYTLSLALQQYKAQHGGTEWSLLMAATAMIIIPVLLVFFFTQKTFVQGITMTGIKE